MIELTITLAIFQFALSYSPGPGNMFFMAHGAKYGVFATLPALLGYHVFTLLMLLLFGYGLGTLMLHASFVFTIIKYIGSAYIIYLAWKIFHADRLQTSENAVKATFTDGAVLLVLNPKAYVIFALVFSQFPGDIDVDHTFAIIWISVFFTLFNLVAFLILIFLSDLILKKFEMILVYGSIEDLQQYYSSSRYG